MNLEQAAQLLSDPLLPPERLQEIAASFPQLHPQILSHPNVYPDLVQWIESASKIDQTQPVPLVGTDGGASSASISGGRAVFSQPPVFAAPAVTPVATAPSRNGNKTNIVIIVLLVLLLLAMLGLAGITIWNKKKQDVLVIETPAQSTSESKSEDKNTYEASPKSNPKSYSRRTKGTSNSGDYYPAPSGAYYGWLVDTPSKNISCELHDSYVGCTIRNHNTGLCGGGEYVNLNLEYGDSSPSISCGFDAAYLGSPGDSVTHLGYGESSQSSRFACSAYTSGMECWDKQTGYGFSLNRDGYDTFAKD